MNKIRILFAVQLVFFIIAGLSFEIPIVFWTSMFFIGLLELIKLFNYTK